MPNSETPSEATADRAQIEPRAIVIVGGGVGAVEALLALTDLGEHRFEVTWVAPNERFSLRALTIAEAFAADHGSDVASLDEIARDMGATLRSATVVGVDADRRVVLCSDGHELAYDALVLAPGATPRQAYQGALTFGMGEPSALNGLLADLEQGYGDSVAFVVPESVSWPLPLYEIALLTARQVHGMNRDVALTFVTPEPSPLALFGPEASAAVAALLAERKITVHCGAPISVAHNRVLIPAAGLQLDVDRVVSLPTLDGPQITGLPVNVHGFIAIDEFCRVRGLQDVYAIGDATDLLVKQGGLACQQADVAARHIAHGAGGPLDAEPLKPVLRGRLITGDTDQFLRRDLEGAHGQTADQALWWPPAKIYGSYLSRFVAHRQLPGRPSVATVESPPPAPPPGIDVEVPLRWEDIHGPSILGLDSLGPMHG
jgi:sulfide:quinone oxidoreductase